VAPVRAGDVVLARQRFADADGHGFLADIEMSEAGHQRARIEIVDALLEQANRHHLAMHPNEEIGADVRCDRGAFCSYRHAVTPAIRARIVYRLAKSCSPRPCARADDSKSLTTEPLGSETFSSRPISSASVMSFCIMFVLNCAWSGIFRTSGPLYCT